MRAVDTEQRVLVRRIALPDAKNQAATGQRVHDRTVFGDLDRVMQRQHQDIRADPDPAGACGNGCGQSQRRARESVRGPVVLGQPYRVESESVGLVHEVEALAIVGRHRSFPSTRPPKVVHDTEGRYGHAP